jgi:hypothetical protein
MFQAHGQAHDQLMGKIWSSALGIELTIPNLYEDVNFTSSPSYSSLNNGPIF